MHNNKLLQNLESLTAFKLAFFLLIFPFVFTTLTLDPLVFPKQVLLGAVSLLALVLVSLRFLVTGNIVVKRTPFDVPIVLFVIALLLSAVLSVNRMDSIVAAVPVALAAILFFSITNNIRERKYAALLAGAISLSAAILSIFTALTYFKIYILPFQFAKNQAFSPFGSLFDTCLFLVIALTLAGSLAYPLLKGRGASVDLSTHRLPLFFAVTFFMILVGIAVSVIGMMTVQKPTLLPLETGFQTSFAAISQDTGRVIQGFLLGSGFGTYLTDFTRFKAASFNANTELWTLSFFRSSSFLLELLATTGVLGLGAFLFLIYRIVRTRPLFITGIVIAILSVILPFSFTTIAFLFITLGVFSAFQEKRTNSGFYDVDFHLLAKKQVLGMEQGTVASVSKVLPFSLFIVVLLITLALLYGGTRFVLSDLSFQSSFVAASKNNGTEAYEKQTKAIRLFESRDGYHRIFSQLNLSLANNLASSVPEGASPSAQQQSTILSLAQQSINSARRATEISPKTSLNWQNLSGIYRSLIGFGENADTFSILAMQQAVALDPNNPQQFVNLGGIFYQLKQYDDAIRHFQTAVSLKPDFANAYYNLGKALEQKGDLTNALAQYQTVSQLVAKDATNKATIDKEIKALQAKIGEAKANPGQQVGEASENQPDLGVNQPATQLPEQNPPVEIPAPPATQSSQPRR